MAILPVPSILVSGEADSAVQNMATDVNDAFNRLAADVNTNFALLDSPELSGLPTAPTAAADDDSTQIATTEFVQDAIDAAAAAQVATQAEQETGSSLTAFVTPGRQHYHQSAAKAWGIVFVSGGTPTLVGSYNVTSITDSAAGILGVTIATDFSNTTYALVVDATSAASADPTFDRVWYYNFAAGSFTIEVSDGATTIEPVLYSFIAFGDQ